MSAQGGLENIFDRVACGQISNILGEFDGEFLPAIIDSTQNFWEEEFTFRLFDINKHESIKDDKYLSGEVFFTSQVQSNNVPPVTLRLSSEFVRLILHGTFGSNSPHFELLNLSELEIKILNAYCDFLYKSFSNILIPPENLTKIELKNKEVYNFVIIVKNKDEKHSKLIVTLPSSRIKKKEMPYKENFSDEEFKNINALVDIEAGSSKIALNDLQSISMGDIILLENSLVNKMKIITGSFSNEFKVNPDPSLMIELDENEHDMDREETQDKNMWDDIQIEVNARFKKVKMTLGELKHISKGLVIDLGSVFNNEISLLVEDKTVAKGELVIINDKYAVKINEVISDADKRIPPAAPKAQSQPQPQAQVRPQAAQNAQAQAQRPQAAPAQKPQPQAQARPQAAQPKPKPAPAPAPKNEVEEDFDYSDFEEEK